MALSRSLDAQERQALQVLLRAGLQTRDALAALDDAAAARQALPSEDEQAEDADAPFDPAWWFANPAVPAELKLLLEASPSTEGAP
jgi:hypothetical protein